MIKHLAGSLVALALLAPAAGAQTGGALAAQPESRLWIEGNSTLRRFECRAATFDVAVATSSREPVAALVAGEEAVSGLDVSVPARRLDCANGTMNAHMYKALKADEAPVIRFRLSSYDLARAGSGVAVTMSGTLTLGGVEKPITLRAEALPGEAGMLRVTGSKEIRMTEFGLKPPTLMLGTLKVADAVNVRFDLLLKPGPAAT